MSPWATLGEHVDRGVIEEGKGHFGAPVGDLDPEERGMDLEAAQRDEAESPRKQVAVVLRDRRMLGPVQVLVELLERIVHDDEVDEGETVADVLALLVGRGVAIVEIPIDVQRVQRVQSRRTVAAPQPT